MRTPATVPLPFLDCVEFWQIRELRSLLAFLGDRVEDAVELEIHRNLRRLPDDGLGWTHWVPDGPDFFTVTFADGHRVMKAFPRRKEEEAETPASAQSSPPHAAPQRGNPEGKGGEKEGEEP